MLDSDPRIVSLLTGRDWVSPRDYRPDAVEMLRRRQIEHRPTLRDDWHDFIASVRAEPFSHAMLALLGFLAGLLLIIVPALVAVTL